MESNQESLIDDSDFEPFFTMEDTLTQQCRLLETEIFELHGELATSREKIATLVLMWTATRGELSKAEQSLREALLIIDGHEKGEEPLSHSPE